MIIIDRIEGDRVVCFICDDNGNKKPMPIDLPLSVFEDMVKEGDVVYEKDARYYADDLATKKRREAARERFDRLRLRHKEEL